MSPEEIASKHPRLFHITRPSAVSSIKEHGLLSTSSLLALFGISGMDRESIETRRRPTNITIHHPSFGEALITDNGPLTEAALAQCLDDGLTPSDWMRLLNQRVFFWVEQKDVDVHLRASIRHGEHRVVLVFNTLSLVSAYHHRVELAAINTGSTMRRPARRGLSTFSPAKQYTYGEWRHLRGGRDRIKELTILGGICDVDAHMTGYYTFPHLDSRSKFDASFT
ncbi:hypothetical protein LGM65_09050 [Burkholderia anthina]|uniref:DUF7002 family protein n=1 Tax=Burkholderia anthina TaxID=179879 RepID=UPI001CF2581C|nr:hypothetical protein [Burkholderia anthina]MCA8091040.1 hypothetical protein [Burkholderia anthina]